jgi:hypothetical protein
MFSENYLEVRGGAWFDTVTVTWPLAMLIATRDEVRLRSSVLSEDIVFSRDEVKEVVRPWGPFGRGLRFVTESGPTTRRPIFWPVPPHRAPVRLKAMGWPMA